MIAEYDPSTRQPCGAEAFRAWRRMSHGTTLHFDGQLGPLVAATLEARVMQLARNGASPLVIGGDHSITWFAVKALADVHGPLTVVHFDAHHDAYAVPYLSHHSVMHHVAAALPVEVRGVGYRQAGSRRAPELTATVAGPAYVSVDADYFSPSLLSSVADPIECETDSICDFETLCRSLALIEGSVVGADFVEWRGADPSSAETAFAQRVVRELAGILGDEA